MKNIKSANSNELKIINKIRKDILLNLYNCCLKFSKKDINKLQTISICINFEPLYTLKNIEQIKFLEILKNKGAIKSFNEVIEHRIIKTKTPYKPTPLEIEEDPEYWLFDYPNEIGLDGDEADLLFIEIKLIPENFIKYFNISFNQNREIETMEFVLNSITNKPYLIILNNNYKQQLPISLKEGKYWDLLYKIAMDKYSNIPLSENKSFFDYFNSNENNKIYTKTGFSRTQILKSVDGYIVPKIKINIITQKTFETRKNKQGKTKA